MTARAQGAIRLDPDTRRARMEQLGEAMQPLRARLADLQAQRPKVWHGTAPDGAGEREVAVTRLQLQLEPLEQELERLITEEDEDRAATLAEQEAALDERREEAEAQLPTLHQESREARRRFEELLPAVTAAVRDVIETADALNRVQSQLAAGDDEHRDARLMQSWRAVRSRVAARLWHASAEGGVEINERPVVQVRMTPLFTPDETP